mmetsp:Transcript_30398/g.47621  ORF Transcript_30398/g.47621 Transcript_30398/m.47621 type:complete len:184 (+) Transcript_30398:146-697(+)
MYPLQFLRYDRAKAAGIIIEKGPKEKENLSPVSENALEDTLAKSTIDDRPSDEDWANQAQGDNTFPEEEGEMPTISGSAGKEEKSKPVAGPFGFCVITGLPAKYKDPVTGQPYANVEAFKELRKQHGGEGAEQQKDEGAGVTDEAEQQAAAEENNEPGEDEEVVEPLFAQSRPKWGLGGASVV